MANILLVGCGDIGAGLGDLMASKGHRCFGLKRHIEDLPESIVGVSGDVTRPETLTKLPADLDYVIYSVAAPQYDEATYRAFYADGLQNILNALAQQGQSPKRVIFVSSSATYHQRDGEWVDESSATDPTAFSGRMMLAAEQNLANSNFTGTSVRFSGIYGPGRLRILNWVKQGVGCQAEPALYSNRIHREDCIGVLAHLIEKDLRGESVEPLYLASDPNPSSYHEVLEWLREQMGLAAPAQYEDFSQRLKTGSKRCNSQRLQDSGYDFIYPSYREGFTPLLDGEAGPA